MTRIKLGVRPGAWFDGHTFSTKDGRPLDEHTLDEVALDLCRRLFKMARWQGEANEHGACVSVGDHSILAGRLARIIAKARDLSDETAELAYRLGVTHDLGEVLGLGDPASPFLRELPETNARSKQHQAAAMTLFNIGDDHSAWGVEAASQVVKDADALAALYERRLFFADHTGDCESPRAMEVFEEVGDRARLALVDSGLRSTGSWFSVDHQESRAYRIYRALRGVSP